MGEFFKNIVNNFNVVFTTATKHQKYLFTIPLLIGIILNVLFGLLGTIMLMLFIGLIMELTYCFVPNKKIMVLGREINVPDYATFKYNIENDLSIKTLNDYNNGNITFVYSSIVAFVIIKLIFAIF